jgi:hypothetical protein
MKAEKPPHDVEFYRLVTGAGYMNSFPDYGWNGVFKIPITKTRLAFVICSDGMGWDHVSVSIKQTRLRTNEVSSCTPTWDEMCQIKDLFFSEEESVVQFHPAKADYVNLHKYCLHLWRPQHVEIPTPPSIMVGPRQ